MYVPVGAKPFYQPPPQTPEQIIREKIAAAKAGPVFWAEYPTRELKRALNELLAAKSLRIEEDGQRSPSICSAIDAIFGEGSGEATRLKYELESLCKQNVNYASYLIPEPPRFVLIDGKTVLQTPSTATEPPVAVPVTIAPRTSLSQFCDKPAGVCFEDPTFGDMVRKAMVAGCANYPISGVRGLGRVCSPPPYGTITSKNYQYFFTNYGPCVLKDIPNCSEAFVPCPLDPGGCIEPEVKPVAEGWCKLGVTPAGSRAPCPNPKSPVSRLSVARYLPCEAAALPACAMKAAEEWTFFSTEDAEDTEEASGIPVFVWVGLGLLAAGGVAYAVMRRK